MSLRIIDIADGYESETVPSVVSIVGLRAVERILSVSEVMDGKIILSIAPSLPSTITLSWQGVSQYISSNDFAVSGVEIIFSGYNLGNIIQVGDVIRLTYQ